MLDTWDEGTHWLIERDGTAWLIERWPWGDYKCLSRCGSIGDAGAIRDRLARDARRVPPSGWAELEDLRGRFLAADRLEDLRAEADAGYYAGR